MGHQHVTYYYTVYVPARANTVVVCWYSTFICFPNSFKELRRFWASIVQVLFEKEKLALDVAHVVRSNWCAADARIGSFSLYCPKWQRLPAPPRYYTYHAAGVYVQCVRCRCCVLNEKKALEHSRI
jgi:hypothetical protein